MSPTPDEVAAEFDTARKLVEEVVAKLGLDPSKVRGEDRGDFVTWSVQRGSAAVQVTVAKSDRGDASYLRAVSPIMSLPPESNLPSFFRRLLELNGRGLVNAAFGIVDDRIVAKSERPTAFLDAAEVEQIILQLSAVADTYDDRLVREFGGTRASDIPVP